MSDLPQLSSQDIRAQLEKHLAQGRRHFLFAFYGTGAEATIELPEGRFDVVPVASELDLRDQLQRYGTVEARAAFLVPWSTEIPMDLAGRFARGGKVLRVGTEARLMRMFGVAEVEPDARRSALAQHLLTVSPHATFVGSSGRLTEAAMWEAWLTARFGVDAPGGLALHTLLAWAATDGRGAELAGVEGGPEGAKLVEALHDFLTRRAGLAASAAFRAWSRGAGAGCLGLAVLCEGEEKLPEAARVWLRQKLVQELGLASVEEAARVAAELGAAVGGALAHLTRRAGVNERRRIVASADVRVDEPAVREALAHHPRLPSAWQARLDALGAVLARCAAAPAADALDEAIAASDRLRSHELFAEETTALKRADMAVRLVAWLVARTDRPTEGHPAPHADAVALATWYAAEGGYIDWARQYARGSGSDAFGRGVNAVVAAADEVRVALDRRFAKGLQAWVEAKRPSSEVVPIDRALERIAAPFLRADAERRLLVVLMDGMAWAQAVELLQALGERAMPWGPLAWHATREGRIGSAPVPAVLAALPTTTEVSRAAFFEGRALGPGDKTSTAKDPDRFEAHRALRELCEGASAPKLLLRAEGSTASGALSEETLTMVGGARRVVGVVINAIDASLKRDPQQHVRWTVDGIRPLADLLDAAQRAGRAILLASDHGHVPTDGLARIGGAGGGGARWRAWEGPADELADGEVKLAGEGVWTPKGKEAVVLLATDRQRYGSQPNAGEHGGASLAEVIAPCLLIGSATRLDDDPGQRVVGAHVPDWWLLRVRSPVERAPEPKAPRAPKKPEAQLDLLAAPPPDAPAKPARAKPRDSVHHPLARSKLFTSLAKSAEEQAPVLRAVDFLTAKRGAATVEAFAAAMGELVYRVPGLVSKLQGVLNVDGYQVLWFDPAGKQVRLDVEKLEQLFEVRT